MLPQNISAIPLDSTSWSMVAISKSLLHFISIFRDTSVVHRVKVDSKLPRLKKTCEVPGMCLLTSKHGGIQYGGPVMRFLLLPGSCLVAPPTVRVEQSRGSVSLPWLATLARLAQPEILQSKKWFVYAETFCASNCSELPLCAAIWAPGPTILRCRSHFSQPCTVPLCLRNYPTHLRPECVLPWSATQNECITNFNETIFDPNILLCTYWNPFVCATPQCVAFDFWAFMGCCMLS